MYRSNLNSNICQDDKTQTLPQTPSLDANGTSSPTAATSETTDVDWDKLSAWCQNFLELPGSDLDSLWWDRIAQAAATESRDNPELVMSLFRRALEKDNPSWLCNFNLAECLDQLDRPAEAIAEIELALKVTEREDARPTPEEADFMWLHFRLGDFHLQTASVQQAAEQYLIVSKSSDMYFAEKGQVAYMKAILTSGDVDGAKKMLQSILAKDVTEGSMVRVLKMIARDVAHSITISKIFTIAQGDSNLLKGVIGALENATASARPGDGTASDMSEDDRFAEDEARGVLLYHRGMMEAYGLSPDGAGSVRGALALWHECRDQLFAIGGPVASTTRTDATTELAKYYFQSLVRDQGPPEHMEALAKLAKEDSSVEGGDPVGYLAALYALRDEKDKARALLSRRIKTALQVLSDDQPDNDYFGHRALFKSLAHFRDFDNSAAALTLMGTPDLLTDALHFNAEDISDEDEWDKDEIMEQWNNMGSQIVRAVKDQVPDSSQQARRIEIAQEHVDALEAVDSQKARTTVIDLLKRRIFNLKETYAATMDFVLSRYDLLCNGLGPSGTLCDKTAGFDLEFYHCIYCQSCDFCPDCFEKLRQGPHQSMQCSSEHTWIKKPRQGTEFYGGFDAKSIRLPVVRPVDGDERVLEATQAGDDEVQELTLEAWKAALAREWNISLDD